MDPMLFGAIAMGWLVAGLYFFRFWHRTKDQFFLWFALSFWLEAISRTLIGIAAGNDEEHPVIYGIRVIAYALILVAIWQKNRPRR